MFVFIFASFLVRSLKGQFLSALNPEHQIQIENLILLCDKSNFEFQTALAFGIMSRYSPLSNIAQVGKLGVFKSNCFHNLNAFGKQSNINFIYYDCIDQENQLITKHVKFIDDNHLEHNYELIIPNDQYENVWYYFQIKQWPLLKIFHIQIMKNNLPILQEELAITYPFYDSELTLTFGGGVNAYFESTLLQHSYFPGQIYVYPTGFYALEVENNEFPIDMLSYLCECTENQDTLIVDEKYFEGSEKITFASANSNCNFFQLTGWLKISEIISEDDDFSFHLISMTKRTQNILFKNQNLSPLNLYYYISNLGNKIVYTTNSHSFPSINVDYSFDPFLIKKEFQIEHSLYQWHYISVSLIDTQFIISIEFPDGINSLKYEQITEVNQFKIVTFEIQIGNIQDSKLNYLNYMVNSFKFSNCDTVTFSQACHYSCSLCDGPTENDCLECQLNSNRIYLQELKKCVCPYDSIDVEMCQTYSDYNFILFQDQDLITQCNYGQFEYNNQCLTCPETVNNQQINCIECITNPKTWKDMFYCQTSIISQNDQSYEDLTDNKYFYIMDGQDVKICQTCKQICSGDDCYEKEFQQNIIAQGKMCSSAYYGSYKITTMGVCYECSLVGCLVCGLSQTGLYCILCSVQTQQINGFCVSTWKLQNCPLKCSYCRKSICYSCYSPYYLNQDKTQCQLCPIRHCKYCFEYENNDLTKTTLYKEFNSFLLDEYTQIGCSLCEDDFYFDFQIGECIFGSSQIANCLRSYKNFQGKEVCVLSAIDDFNLAPGIINCQQHLDNCQQCILNPDEIIKCVQCENGFTVTNSGNCEVCTLEVYSTSCIEADSRYMDYWIQSIQSFMMQFLPNSYYYPQADTFLTLQVFPLSCPDGYKQGEDGNCHKYCDSDCVTCTEINYDIYFKCTRCPLSYFGFLSKSVKQGNCVQCPNLCLACQERTSSEILAINSNFLITSQNALFTYKCLLSIPDQKIKLDPYLQIASYCFDIQCSRSFQIQYSVKVYFEQGINLDDASINYCNQMGILIFQLKLIFDEQGVLSRRMYSIYKQQIFSLQKNYLKLIGNFDQGMLDYDRIELHNFIFKCSNTTELYITNQESSVDLFMIDCIFKMLEDTYITSYQINLNLYQDFKLQNVSLINLYLTDSSFIEYNSIMTENYIQIYLLNIQNCTFLNYSIFSFLKFYKSIVIQQITISNSTFVNSTFIKVNYSTQHEQEITIDTMNIIDSQFYSSQIIKSIGYSKVKITQLKIINNIFNNTIIIESEQEGEVDGVYIMNSIFFQSVFFRAIKQVSLEKNILQRFSNFFLSLNKFLNSTLILFIQENTDIFTAVEIDHFIHMNLSKYDESEVQGYLYNINSQNLSVFNFTIRDSQNLPYFRIYHTSQINLNQINYINTIQNQKILPHPLCYGLGSSVSTLLYVLGFQIINLNNINVINQFSVDNSIIHIITDLLFEANQIETIIFNNIKFEGNILLKSSLASYFSNIVIYSETIQIINFQELKFIENFFHQHIDDPSMTAAGLIYINSQLSNITVYKLSCQSNGITNSSSSIIYMNSKILNLQILNLFNINSMQSSIWFKYYQIDLIDTSEDIKGSIVQKIFNILTNGGAGQFQSSNILIINSYFRNIIAFSSSGFLITTQGQGVIQFTNNTIIQSSILPQYLTADGCITIISTNSLLILQFSNIYFENVYNQLNSAIFTIYPSLKQNIMNFTNITLNNSFALINCFLAIEFPSESALMHNLYFKQIFAKFTYEGWNDYIKQINYPSISDLAKIKSNNGFINLKGCSVIISKIEISGYIISPILLLSDIGKLQLVNFSIQNVQIMYPFYIICFTYSLQKSHYIIVKNLYLTNTTQYQIDSNIELIKESNDQILNYYIKNCSIVLQLYQSSSQNQTFQTLIQSLNQNSNPIGSLFYVSGLTELSKISATKIVLMNNKCNFCQSGLISFQQNTQALIQIENLICFNNYIKQFGCLILLNDNLSIHPLKRITVKTSTFNKNNGSIGIGIYSENNNLLIQKSKILSNIASDKAGGIFIADAGNQFSINKIVILNNSATIGGGLYLNGNNFISKYNFINSFLLFNQASNLSNNLVESPNHLTLKLNTHEMQSIKLPDDIDALKLMPYKFQDQDNIITTNYLYFPSNQQLKTYKRFDSKKLEFQSYITELALFQKNSLNEEIKGQDQDYCQVTLNQFNQYSSSPNQNNSVKQVIHFDSEINSFDLENLLVNFDPYNSLNIVARLQFQCNSEIGKKILYYQIDARTFLCQLGEFYTNGNCQVCEPAYGFYSVKYNKTRCSVFDPERFISITQNLIELKEGYWRPDYQSDSVENCFKNTKACTGGWDVNYYSCSQGHIGGLCEECDIYNVRGDGYYAKTDNIKCVECEDGFEQQIPFIFLTIWSFISILMTLNSIWNTNKTFARLKAITKLYEIVFNLNQGINNQVYQDFHSILLKMLLNYLWIFSIMLTFNIHFDFSFETVNKVSTPSASIASNLDCQLRKIDQADLVYIRIITTFLFINFQVIAVSLCYKLFSKIFKFPYDNSIIINSGMHLYISNQASLIKRYYQSNFFSLGSLTAVRKISEINYIQGNVNLLFYDSNHLKWNYIFVIPALAIFGGLIPVVLFVIFIQNKNKFNNSHFRKYLGYLYNEYGKENKFWESVKIIQKTIIIIFLTSFETNTYLQATLISLTMLIYQMLAQKRQPYVTKKLNLLDIESGQIILFANFLAIIKYVSEQNNQQTPSLILSIIIICLLLRLFFSFVYEISIFYHKKYFESFLILLKNITSKFAFSNFISLYFIKKLNNHKEKILKLQTNCQKLRLSIILSQQRRYNTMSNRSLNTRSLAQPIRILDQYRFEKYQRDIEQYNRNTEQIINE